MQQRNTFQQALTLDAVKHMACHPTADMVFDYIKESYPQISRTTVYRNLNKLADNGMLTRVKVSGSADRFDHLMDKHYHFICNECGCLSDLEVAYHNDINKLVEGLGGRQINAHQILFDGLCKKCVDGQKSK